MTYLIEFRINCRAHGLSGYEHPVGCTAYHLTDTQRFLDDNSTTTKEVIM
jgi:hypothetical protein